jgi:hypothetical protein
MIKKIKNKLFSQIEPKFRVPRVFSNDELKKFAHIFGGKIVNVSGWTDEDKQGGYYKDYFSKKSEYWITNYKEDEKGMVGQDNEIFLDLEQDLDESLIGKFDVAFNHTVLEHVYDCHKAFKNICLLSKDIVIVVVPYIQQVHGSGYLDYWRFTPHAMKRMYEDNGVTLRYCSANGADKASIYLVCIGYKDKKWDEKIPARFDMKLDDSKELYADNYTNVIGGNIL